MCKSNFQCSCNNGWTLKDCSLQVKCPGIVKPKAKLSLKSSSNANTNSSLLRMRRLFHVLEMVNVARMATANVEKTGMARIAAGIEYVQTIAPVMVHALVHPKAESIKRAMVATAVAGKASFIEERADTETNASNASSLVYCHCDEGFSGRDCSTPRENIIQTVIHMSVSMRKMKKKTLWRNLEQGWGTNLVVAISNFVGVPPERILLGLKKDKWISKKLFLLETSEKTEEGRLLLSGRSGTEMRKKRRRKEKNRITIGETRFLL